MLPRSCCRVLEKELRRRLTHCLPLDHPKALFLVDFDSGQRYTACAGDPIIAEELMKDGQGLGAAWGYLLQSAASKSSWLKILPH